MCTYVRVNDTKQSSLSLDNVVNIDVSLYWTSFSLSFAGMAMGYIDLFKQGYSSSRIIVSLFQTVSQKTFFSSVWYKQDKLRFTIVMEYYWWKCRWFSTCPNVSVLLLRQQPLLSFFNLSAHDGLFSESDFIHLLFLPLTKRERETEVWLWIWGKWLDLMFRVL